MPPSDFRAAIVEYVRSQARPVDKFSHQPRLYRLAAKLGAGQSYDDDVLFAAAWLHDLGVFLGHLPADPDALATWDCVRYVVARAPEILRQFGFPEEKIPAVVEAIRTHQPSAQPTTHEGVLLRDADILEQLGAVGVLRTVSKTGRDTRYPTFKESLQVLRQNVENLPGQLQLPRACEWAVPRVRLLREFLESAQAEADGEPL